MPKVKTNKKVRVKPFDPVEKKKFRLQYKTVGLTYSRCPLDKTALRDFLLKLSYEISEYYIVQETHKQPKDGVIHHLHAWFEFASRPNVQSESYFDFEGYHPNIGKKRRNWIYNYLQKQDCLPVTNIDEGYIALAKRGKYQEAMDQFANQHPKDFVINYTRISRHMSILGKCKRQENIYPFTGDPIEWDMEEKSLLLVGPSRTGKTEWAKSFVTHYLKKTFLRVTHIDKLKEYNGEDFIIFDDIDFSHLPRETQIHICEVRNSRSIHCRHSCADIPPGICNIFLSNKHPFIDDPYGAIQGRLYSAPEIRFY